MPIQKLNEKVESIKEDTKKVKQEVVEMEEKVEKLQDNLGVLDIYKEIIRSNKQANNISMLAIVVLFILVIILTITLIHNEKEFTAYRENSIKKGEIVEIIKEAHSDCEF